MAAFGLRRESDDARSGEELVFWLWPQHVPALELWCAAQTQWRHGLGGPTGLDYAGVRASPTFEGMDGGERERAFADLCVMECAALAAWADQRPFQSARDRA